MAKQDKKKVSKLKIKKKLWFKVLAPKLFGMKELGESYLPTVESAVGRSMKVSLKELTGNVKDQNVHITFKITGVQNSKLNTKVTGYSLTSAYIKRVVKKNTNRIDNYFTFQTKDGQNVVAKPLMVTVHKTKRSVNSELSKQLQQNLSEEISKIDFDSLINALVYHKLQQALKKKLSKVYPIRELSIKSLILKGEKGTEIKVEEPQSEEEAEPQEEVKEEIKEVKQEDVEKEAPAEEKESVEEKTEEPVEELAEEQKSEEAAAE